MSETVTRQIVVRVPVGRAFDAFVEIQDVLAWLADGAVIGRRVGGNWGLGWYADPDSDAGYQSIGTFEVYEPPSRLVVRNLTFSTPEGEEFGPMRLTVDFVPLAENETRVAVTQEGVAENPAWDDYRVGIGPGWDRTLGDLKGWLEEGRKLPGR